MTAELITCADCGMDTADPSFVDMVIPDHIWERVAPSRECTLCLSCIVRRLRFNGETDVPFWIINGPLQLDWEVDIPFHLVGSSAYGWIAQWVLALSDREREKLKRRMAIVAAVRRMKAEHGEMNNREQFDEAGKTCGVSGRTAERLWKAVVNADERGQISEWGLLPARQRRGPPLTPLLRQWIADVVERKPSTPASAVLESIRPKVNAAGLDMPSTRSIQRVMRYLADGGDPYGGGHREDEPAGSKAWTTP